MTMNIFLSRWRRVLKPQRWALLLNAGKALRLMIPLLRDCLLGRYRPWPWKALVLAACIIGYLLMPFDLVPDVIPFWGLLDDAVICGWLLSRLYDAMLPWRLWRAQQNRAQ